MVNEIENIKCVCCKCWSPIDDYINHNGRRLKSCAKCRNLRKDGYVSRRIKTGDYEELKGGGEIERPDTERYERLKLQFEEDRTRITAEAQSIINELTLKYQTEYNEIHKQLETLERDYKRLQRENTTMNNLSSFKRSAW